MLWNWTGIYYCFSLVDGEWMEWGQWSTCSTKCMQTRERTCHGPKYGGKDCVGQASEERTCKGGKCNVMPACTCDYKLERFTCLKWDRNEIERNFEGM